MATNGTTIRFPADLAAELQTHADQNERTFSSEVIFLCKLGLAVMRDREALIAEAEAKPVVKQDVERFVSPSKPQP